MGGTNGIEVDERLTVSLGEQLAKAVSLGKERAGTPVPQPEPVAAAEPAKTAPQVNPNRPPDDLISRVGVLEVTVGALTAEASKSLADLGAALSEIRAALGSEGGASGRATMAQKTAREAAEAAALANERAKAADAAAEEAKKLASSKTIFESERKLVLGVRSGNVKGAALGVALYAGARHYFGPEGFKPLLDLGVGAVAFFGGGASYSLLRKL